MSYASAIEPLRAANQIAGHPLYRWCNGAPAGEIAVSSSGASVLIDFSLRDEEHQVDLMFVCAGGNPAEFNDERTLEWLRRLTKRGVAVGGISGGPFIMAKAGLLAGRRCTVHWEHMAAFRESFSDVQITRSLFEIDGDRLTCSGGVAALDMMVALIARDHGPELGAAVGDWFVHTQLREGRKPQRMDARFRFGINDERILKALKAMEAHIENCLPREQLAQLAGMSLRQLERAVRAHLGRGVHEHYLMLRLERALQLLRQTRRSMLEIAVATGFSSASQFSRAFHRQFGYPPKDATKDRAVKSLSTARRQTRHAKR
jgi:transcriptional regulator GlxA family with amidase domain